MPACLLGGGRSPAHLRARLDALARVLPHRPQVTVLPGQGHAAHPTAPAEVAWAVEDFADTVFA